MLLPQIERRHVSLRALDRRITVLFYNFAATNTFLGAVLGGTVFMQIGSLLSNPGERTAKQQVHSAH